MNLRIKNFFLFESPDFIDYIDDIYLQYDDDDARIFGYKDDEYDWIFANKTHGSYTERYNWMYPGRLWIHSKIMSFWKYPEPNEFIDMCNKIGEELGYSIWNDGWQVEIIYNRETGIKEVDNVMWENSDVLENLMLIPIEEYAKYYNGMVNFSEEEIKQQHVLSPMLKKREIAPEFWKIRAKKEKPLPFKQKIHQEKFIIKFNKFGDK